jgi:hypothetical protein
MHRYTDEQVAEVCHGAFSGLQSATGDNAPSPPWLHLAPDLKEAAIEGVRRVRQLGASLSPRDHHQEWLEIMRDRGWRHGRRDPEARTHPDLVDWEDLPPAEQDKDRMFIAIVVALTLDDLLLGVLVTAAAALRGGDARCSVTAASSAPARLLSATSR